MRYLLLSFIMLFLLFFTCSPDRQEQLPTTLTQEKEIPLLFELLSDSITNVDFNNQLVETSLMNALNYDYMYNGAGVSVGDFNQDDLPDLYFVSNTFSNKLYLNQGNFKFKDITGEAGISGQPGFSTGTTIVDINNDGRLDLYVCKSGAFEDADKRRNELFVNQGNDENGIPTFLEVAATYNLDLPHYSTQATFFDYDRDGDLDLFVINHNVNSEIHYNLDKYRAVKSPETSDRLFRNDNNQFVDVSDEAGLINDGISFGLGLSVGDLNNDGWADVVVGQDFASKDRIYLNQQNGQFKEVGSEVTGHTSNFSMGNDIADINNDGWLDFMSLDMVSEDNYGIKASMSGMNPERFQQMLDQGFHYQYMYNALQINNGISAFSNVPYFSDVASLAGISSTDWSWGPLFFDMDNDGDKDLFISNGIKRDFRNVDYIHYRERAEQAFLEKIKNISPKLRSVFQKQHDKELIQKMPPRMKANYLYENRRNLSFIKRNNEWIIDRLTASNGATYADLDNDGDLDLITNNMDEVAGIYRNKSRELGLGNYLKVQLNGSEKNKMGVGARVAIKTKAGKQFQEQHPSRGFQSSTDRILFFGLGAMDKILQLKVTWADGRTQSIESIAVNQMVTLNYTDAQNSNSNLSDTAFLFRPVAAKDYPKHLAKQNTYNDFKKESLLPHKMSEEGPALAVGDINQDGLDDFYLGGAKGFAGVLYMQTSTGEFQKNSMATFQKDNQYEDVHAAFFDVDQDGDLDLYVVSGSNEYETNSPYYIDRMYRNEGGQFEKVTEVFDKPMAVSGSVVRPHDFDEDGDLDLFVGGRQQPGKYPHAGTSLLWKNETRNGQIKLTLYENPVLEKIGMVTDAIWTDLNVDSKKELVVVGEWMPLTIFSNDNGTLKLNDQLTPESTTGWWLSIAAGDFDKDGDMDLVAGNLGRNSKYKASPMEPFKIHSKDFDQTGTLDIVLSFHQEGEEYPLRGRECSSNQMPFIKQKFPTYHTFASASLKEVYGEANLATALQYEVNNFSTSYFENQGDGRLKIQPLPNLAQVTSVKKIIPKDIDADGHLDLLLFGNWYGFEVETPRQDAGYGLFLKGKGDGTFAAQMLHESGLFIKGAVADAAFFNLSDDRSTILVAKNNDYIQMIEVNASDIRNK